MIDGVKSDAFPGSTVVPLTRKTMSLIQPNKYLVTWKAVSRRCLMMILHEGVFLVDRDLGVHHLPNMLFPRRKAPQERLDRTLLDGEIVIDMDQNKAIPRFLVFDIVRIEDHPVGRNLSLDKRLMTIQVDIIEPRRALAQTHDFGKEPLRIRQKMYFPLRSMPQVSGALVALIRSYFTPCP